MPLRLLNVSPRPLTWGVALVVLTAIWGCSEDTTIRRYTVSKKDAGKAREADAVVGKEQRMLGVIVPSDQSAWYFKMVDDAEKVDKYESDFRQMVESVKFDSNGSPQWQLTEGWSQQLLRQVTYARLTHKTDGISATVTQLSAPTADEKDWRNSVFENVNRWRGQLSLSPQDWASMEPELEEVPRLSEGPAKAYFVSLVGKKSAAGGMGSAPFMNQAGGAPFASPPTGTGVKTPSSVSPQQADTPAEPTLAYTAPEGWKAEDATGIRKLAFAIEDGEKPASVVVSTASVKPEMLVDMWLGQLGLDPTEELKQQVSDSTQAIDVNGIESTLYSLEGSAGESILVARIPWNERESLFVKLTGSTALVSAQRTALMDFLKSLKW